MCLCVAKRRAQGNEQCCCRWKWQWRNLLPGLKVLSVFGNAATNASIRSEQCHTDNNSSRSKGTLDWEAAKAARQIKRQSLIEGSKRKREGRKKGKESSKLSACKLAPWLLQQQKQPFFFIRFESSILFVYFTVVYIYWPTLHILLQFSTFFSTFTIFLFCFLQPFAHFIRVVVYVLNLSTG